MSFSIGPYIGKRDAVIQAVRKNLSESLSHGPNEQLQQTADYMIAELQKAPEKQTCIAQAWGHADVHGRYCTVGVNQIPLAGGMVPQLVE